jgi:hypothetical protein
MWNIVQQETIFYARPHNCEKCLLASSCPSAYLSANISAPPIRRISLKLHIRGFYKNLFDSGLKWTKISCTLREDLSTFLCCLQ